MRTPFLRRSTLSLLALLTSACSTLVLGQGVYFSFDTPGEYTNNFAPRHTTGNNAAVWFEAGTGGVNGSRALDGRGTGDENTATHTQTSFDFSQPGKVLYASIMVKVKAPSSNNRLMQLGFISRTNSSLTGFDGTAFMSARVNSKAQPAVDYAMEHQTKVAAGTSTSQGPETSRVILTAGRWYKLSVIFTNTTDLTAGTYTVTATFDDYGTDGVTDPVNIFTIAAQTVTNASITSDPDVYLAFRSFENTGSDNIDNAMAYTMQAAPLFKTPLSNVVVEENRTVTFAPVVDGIPPYPFKWYSNNIVIEGATAPAYTTPRLAVGSYSYKVALGRPTSIATVTVTEDTTAPVLVSAGSLNGGKVGLAFDEALSPETATVAANYAVSGGVVESAALRADGQTVELTLSTATAGAFTVTVNNVADLAGNPVAANSQASGTVMGFVNMDLNAPASAGSTFTAKDGEWDVTAGGADIWGNADQGHFILTQKSGDFDVAVRVQKLDRSTYINTSTGRDEFAKAGLVVRESLDANSRTIHMLGMPAEVGHPRGGNRYEHGTRTTTGGGTGSWASNSNGTSYPNQWIRIRRAGDSFITYRSTDGVTWSITAQTSQAYPSTLYTGVGTTIHYNTGGGYVATAEYRGWKEISYPGAVLTLDSDIQPATTNITDGQTVAYSVVASVAGGGASTNDISYQWQRSDGAGGFTNILSANATSPSYTTPPLFIRSDTGAAYRVVIKVAGGETVTSGVATIDSITDTLKPVILSVQTVGLVRGVRVVYSEPIDLATALNSANYVIKDASANTVAVTSVIQIPDAAPTTTYGVGGTTVILQTETALNFGVSPYTVTVSGILDRAATPNQIDETTPVIMPTQGIVRVDTYTGMSGTAVPATFPTGTPNIVSYPTTFNYAPNIDNYLAKISGYYIPPANGMYRFFIRSDDASQLFMSTNNAGDTMDPAQKVLVAREDACCKNYGDTSSGGPRTTPGIAMTAGRAYYIEGWVKEGGGGDFMRATVREAAVTGNPSDQNEAISGAFLASPTASDFLAVAVQPTGSTVMEGASATVSVNVTGFPAPSYQWYRDGVAIAGATSSSYTISRTALTDDDAAFTVVASNVFGSVTSSPPAVVSIDADVTAPQLLSVGSLNGAKIGLQFDELLTEGSATNLANYSINGGAVAIASAVLRPNGTSVELTLAAPVTADYSVAATGIIDRAAAANSGGGSRNGRVEGFDASDLGVPGLASSTFVGAANTFEIVAGGADIWGNADQGHFAYTTVSGNFDVRVRVESLTRPDNISKAGLMVRESVAADSRTMHILANPPPPGRNLLEPGQRTATAGGTGGWGSNFNNSGMPIWVRITRSGDVFTAFYSQAGAVWTQFAQTTQAYPASVLVGMAASAHNNATLATAVFKDVTFNELPVAANDSLGTVSGATAAVAASKLLANDTDADGEALTVTAVTAGSANGTVALAGDVISYTPAAGFIGTDTFTYTIMDTVGGSATATVTVQVRDAEAISENSVALVVLPNGHRSVQFAGIPGRTYQIQATDTLSPAAWVTIATLVAGPNGMIEVEDPADPAPPQRFYRTIAP